MSEPIKPSSFRYRPDIDGLRTLAVVAVVLFHFGFGVPGGFIGVDIFFVISGYLITSIICKDLAKGTFSMAGFWERRIRRIFPALVLVVTLVCVTGVLVIYPDGFKGFSKEVMAQAGLVSNFYFWQQDGYFAAPSDSRPLLHTWSLAVEEQFYFVFPIFLVWVHKAKPRRIMKWVGWVFMASFLWSLYGVYAYPGASFFLLPARAWELLLGSVVALYKFKRGFSARMNEVMSWVGMALMVVPMFWYDKSTVFPGLTALPPCLGAALIIFCNHEKMGSAARLLALPPMVFIGKISYSLYLWHWPLFVFFKYTAIGELSVTTRLGLLAASFVLAILSWKYVETPFRKNSLIPERKKVFRIFYAITAVYLIFGTLAYRGAKKDGWAWRFSDDVYNITKVSMDPLYFPVPFADIMEPGKFPKIVAGGDSLQSVPVLLWGDSHANAMSPLLHKMCRDYGMNIYGAVGGGYTPVMGDGVLKADKITSYNSRVFELVKKHKIKDVIIIGRWDGYIFGADNLTNENEGGEAQMKQKAKFAQLYGHTVKSLKEAGVRVWMMRQVPVQYINVPHAMANMRRFGSADKAAILKLSTSLKQHRGRQEFANEIIDRHVSDCYRVFDPTAYYTEGTHCRMQLDGFPLYRDHDHVSELGSLQLEPMFKPMFEFFRQEYLGDGKSEN